MLNEMRALTVSELTHQIKQQLEGSFFHCVVEGEISNIAFPASGHVYFSLKDSGASLRVVAWRTQADKFRELLRQGEKVEIRGSITLYAPRGEYQLVANQVSPQGVGALYAAFEKLKNQLRLEGLFEPHHKKIIPAHPRKIGIVTSQSAAALQDVLKTLRLHRPDIETVLYPSLVQGAEAPASIVNALNIANARAEVDVILLVRGGGSIEDLWAFNDEAVARAIFASNIPIISGVGHETDTTIADYVADLRAETPTMAAKLSAVSQDELRQALDLFEMRMMGVVREKVTKYRRYLHRLSLRLQAQQPAYFLKESRQTLGHLSEKLEHLMVKRLNRYQQQLTNYEARLNPRHLAGQQAMLSQQLSGLESRMTDAVKRKQTQEAQSFETLVGRLNNLNPLAVLSRGYSAVKSGDQLISSVASVNQGDELTIVLSDGEVVARAKTITPHENSPHNKGV